MNKISRTRKRLGSVGELEMDKNVIFAVPTHLMEDKKDREIELTVDWKRVDYIKFTAPPCPQNLPSSSLHTPFVFLPHEWMNDVTIAQATDELMICSSDLKCS
ncbi:hypothetical protein QAD02_023715 [Eretmocerus hayati]|uniref:Uncharacterized protein n=1 Tax=Eretmocerus hayati TaxID=131215 RepID=A0ACC2PWY4_9HYME|nr:hypothetical protein QAD02_023715 [Eretmocerus hayati]